VAVCVHVVCPHRGDIIVIIMIKQSPVLLPLY